MADWPLREGGPLLTSGTVVASSTKTTITASGSTNTKGSYTQLVASTTYEGVGLVVWITTGNTGRRFLLDIAFGAGGSETVVVPNIFVDNSAALSIPVVLPIHVPAGTRISARCQSTTGSSTLLVAVTVAAAGFKASQPFERVTAYGITTASSTAISVNPGATPNTKPASFTTIDAACANPITMLTIIVGDATVTSMTLTDYLVDVAIGAASSEQIIAPDLVFRSSSAIVTPASFTIAVPRIPSGTRLSARCSCGTASQLLEVALYGMD